MFWWLLVAVASAALMLLLQCVGVLAGYREGDPGIVHLLGAILSVVVLVATMPVIVFLDYKVQKKKGNVVRLIPVFERAIAQAEEARGRRESDTPDSPKES